MSLADKLATERRARLAAEHMLEKTRSDLFDANRKLDQHARKLSDEIIEKRQEVANAREEHSQVLHTLESETQRFQIAESRLKEGLDIIRTGFAVYDSESQLLSANKAYLSIFDGLEEIQPGIAYWRVLQLITEEGIVNIGTQPPIEWRAQMLERWQMDEPDPHLIQLWNGEWVQLIDRRSPEGDMVSMAMNITERVRYEEELKAATVAAQEASRAKSAFLANMSHEIRTPMNGVMGMADLLTDTTLDDEQQLYVETIKNSSDALLVIINDVLDFSKIEAGKMAINPEPFDLERCLHEVLMLLAPTVRDKGLDLVMDLDMFMPTRFVGDAGRLRQVLMNLLGNAAKFTTAGHIVVRVVGLDLGNGKNSVVVNVEDTGIGIPPEKQAHIFGEFNQVEDERNRQFDGTGLGLAITQRLVKLMGGDIWVDSEVDVGSCFGFSLPMPLADDAELPEIKLPVNLRSALIVDDQEINRRILVKQLEVLGLKCQTAGSADAALSRDLFEFDLIITDQIMPGLSGMEFIQEARARGYDKAMVLASSSGMNDDIVAGEHGVTRVLQKPVSRSELFSMVQSLGSIVPQAEPEPSADDTQIAAPDPEGVSQNPISEPKAVVEVEPLTEAPKQSISEDSVARASTSEEPAASPAAPPPATEPEPDKTAEKASKVEPVAPSNAVDAEPAAPEPLAPAQAPDTEHVQPQPEPKAESKPEPAIVPAEGDAPAEPNVDAAPEPRAMRVLAAEDNKTNQLVFKKMVKAHDIELELAKNGLEAVELFKTFKPDLIFMDISMPQMDGKQATREIRAIEQEQGGHVPICAMTAHAMTGDKEEILSHGLDDYLTKPLNKGAIADKIRECQPDQARPAVAD